MPKMIGIEGVAALATLSAEPDAIVVPGVTIARPFAAQGRPPAPANRSIRSSATVFDGLALSIASVVQALSEA